MKGTVTKRAFVLLIQVLIVWAISVKVDNTPKYLDITWRMVKKLC